MNKRSALPSLDLLKAFEAVARHLSFTRAGSELFITQSAVSRQIRLLEEHMGVKLFERRARTVALTDVGNLYYAEVQRALAHLEEVTRTVAGTHASSRLRVTATLTFSSLWLVPRLAEFQAKHPAIQVHVVADNAVRDLARDDLDVSIRYSSSAVAGEGAIRLFGETVTPVCSPVLLKKHSLKSVEDLARFPLIHFNDLEGRAPWLSWDAWFTQTGRAAMQGAGAVYFSHYEQAIRAARAAQGVALGRLPVIDALLQEGELVAPLREGGAAVTLPNLGYWLVRSQNPARKQEIAAFAAWVAESAARSAAPAQVL